MTITPFPAERRARDEAVKLARLHHYGAMTTLALIRSAVRKARTMLPADAARCVVKAPDEPMGAA
jgi:hypothetical protein